MPVRHVLASATAAAVLASVGVSPAEAAAPLRFTRVQYDSPGTDNGSNKSLNAEWVRVTNHGSKVRNLSGWKIRDETGYTYRFPRGFRLRPGRSVRVHTGKGRNTRTDLHWRRTWYVWNNTGDRAVLRNRAGNRVDACSWGDGSGTKVC